MLVLLWIIYTACCCYGVSRAIDWFPAQFAREESELINAIIRQHEAGQPVTFATLPVDDTPAAGSGFWRLPDFKFRNLLVMLCVVLVNISAVFCLGDTYRALAWTIFGGGLLALAFIDARIKMLPDALTLPLLWLGLLIQLFPETRTVGLELSVIGVLAGYVPLWLFSQAYRLIRKRQGLGMGDLKLLAAAPKLQKLSLWGAGITDAGLDQLTPLVNLTDLGFRTRGNHDPHAGARGHQGA